MDLIPSWKDLGAVVGAAAPILGNILVGNIPGAALTAGTLIASAFGVEATPQAVAAAVQADPMAAIKLAEIETAGRTQLQGLAVQAAANELAAETARLAEINATMRVETQSEDAYVRRMRPTWGYSMCLVWIVQGLAIAWCMLMEPQWAAELIQALAGLTTMYGIGLAVLGLHVVGRTLEKNADGPSVAPRLLDRLRSVVAPAR